MLKVLGENNMSISTAYLINIDISRIRLLPMAFFDVARRKKFNLRVENLKYKSGSIDIIYVFRTTTTTEKKHIIVIEGYV
jgi:hypothetical protein